MPGLLAAMAHEYPAQALRSHPEIDIGVRDVNGSHRVRDVVGDTGIEPVTSSV
jgi:hypothetical protein